MQLDLGLKAQVRAMAPKSAGIAKLLLFKAILAKRKLFLIIHELSVPAQTAVNGSLMQVAVVAPGGTAPTTHYHSRPRHTGIMPSPGCRGATRRRGPRFP